MINIHDKRDCCGCSACVQRCPQGCISLQEDTEGFLYPQVNSTECINCDLCKKVCPLVNRMNVITPKQVFAVKNKNEEERLNSSSGGVFIALARDIINSGGVVFGVVYDEKWELKHTYTEILAGVMPMMGSKYLQSRVESSYQQAEKFLKQGRKVLFSGTPCQIAGLRAFLGKAYPYLLTVDLVCHGVPSPGVWRKYIKEIEIDDKLISSISFRDKKAGWKNYSFVIYGKLDLGTNEKSVLLSEIHRDNLFMKGFLANIYLRPSCYLCKCKNGVSNSDITIADYWGINQIMPDFDDDKGVGLVLLSTEKGYECFSALGMIVKESSYSDACLRNGGFCEYIKEHPRRADFFAYSENRTIAESVIKCLQKPMCKISWNCCKKWKRIILKSCNL